MKTHVIIVTQAETRLQSWMRDLSTFVLFAALIGAGVWMESTAMQAIGALVGIVIIVAKATQIRDNRYFDPAEAHAEVDRIAALIRAEEDKTDG